MWTRHSVEAASWRASRSQCQSQTAVPVAVTATAVRRPSLHASTTSAGRNAPSYAASSVEERAAVSPPAST